MGVTKRTRRLRRRTSTVQGACARTQFDFSSQNLGVTHRHYRGRRRISEVISRTVYSLHDAIGAIILPLAMYRTIILLLWGLVVSTTAVEECDRVDWRQSWSLASLKQIFKWDLDAFAWRKASRFLTDAKFRLTDQSLYRPNQMPSEEELARMNEPYIDEVTEDGK